MLLIFDLDGTLIDSQVDLIHSVNAMLLHMDRGTMSDDAVRGYIGNGALALVQRVLGPGMSDDDIAAAHDYFIAHYKEHSLDTTTLYPGVGDALRNLSAAGHRLAILTNKPKGISRNIVAGLGIGEYFFSVLGGNSFWVKKPHPIGIDTLCEKSGIAKADTWMIGDSSVDIETARNAGVRSCGVTYGIKPESLKDVPPDLLVDHLDEFVRYIR